jgi:hypothetical protein
VVNGKLDVADVIDKAPRDVEDDEDPALDFVAGTLELAAAELFAEDGEADDDRLGRKLELAITEPVAAADEEIEVEFGPSKRKATTKSEGADEGSPNWLLKWQVPAESPSKVKPTQPSVTSQMVMQAVKPPP